MERFVLELKKLMSFKDTTEVGDIVLIAAKEPQMLLYAKITGIERDFSRKDEWWHLKMTVLSIPVQKMVWTLRTPQMTGMEIFTMGGEERFVKAIDFSDETTEPKEEKKPASKPSGKIAPFRRVK
ncbi:hypothetical protein [Desulfopila aestuarii]|uniref:Uncharacterized protein n=1 Tax=Desulfopila aestuarii DSM 18488 TaxID=1121416 RepID=A0A1M7YKL5_9BACT|nr:hypothetical protein [Desulfopila aestuarii]SHO53180.1 hypothetical protein SAMN02745220_04990 [Desulfopila aestuarii DSM 18488]